MNFKQDIAGVAQALGLKKQGHEYHGPCPCCGGTDRFWIKQGKTKDIVISCRQGCDFADLAKEMYDRGLAERDDFKPTAKPQYLQKDLDYCDLYIQIARGRHWKDFALNDHDLNVITVMMTSVDEKRRKALRELIEEKRSLPKKKTKRAVDGRSAVQTLRLKDKAR